MLLMLWPVWPAGSPNFVLETATRLAPEAWVPVTDPPVQIGDVYMLQVGTSEPHRYYRLRLKAP
jgi:hypothetical protein